MCICVPQSRVDGRETPPHVARRRSVSVPVCLGWRTQAFECGERQTTAGLAAVEVGAGVGAGKHMSVHTVPS